MDRFVTYLTDRNKALLALIGAVLAWATLVVDSPAGPISAKEWLALGIGAAGVIGVERVTNAGSSE